MPRRDLGAHSRLHPHQKGRQKTSLTDEPKVNRGALQLRLGRRLPHWLFLLPLLVRFTLFAAAPCRREEFSGIAASDSSRGLRLPRESTSEMTAGSGTGGGLAPLDVPFLVLSLDSRGCTGAAGRHGSVHV